MSRDFGGGEGVDLAVAVVELAGDFACVLAEERRGGRAGACVREKRKAGTARPARSSADPARGAPADEIAAILLVFEHTGAVGRGWREGGPLRLSPQSSPGRSGEEGKCYATTLQGATPRTWRERLHQPYAKRRGAGRGEMMRFTVTRGRRCRRRPGPGVRPNIRAGAHRRGIRHARESRASNERSAVHGRRAFPSAKAPTSRSRHSTA